MSDVIPATPLMTTPPRSETGIRALLRFRAGLLIGLLVAGVCGGFWLTHRAVWAVAIAGGVTATLDLPPAGPGQLWESLLPEFTQPFVQLSTIKASRLLPADWDIFAVSLVEAPVDHRWMPHLGSMVALTWLAVEQRQIGPELASLGRLTNLRSLKVVNARSGSDLKHLLNLSHLEQIRFVNPAGLVDGFESLGQLPSLHFLEIEALDATAPGWATLLRQCDGWSNIETVSIRTIHPVTSGLEALRSCPSLRTLAISAPLSPADLVALAQVEQLTSLTLDSHRLVRNAWRPLGQLSHLTSLKIYVRGDERPPLEELLQALPHCEIEIGP